LQLTDDGILFFRESCFRQSGDRARKNNPTHYRNPREYFAIFDGVSIPQPDGRVAHLELVCCKCIDTYILVKQNQNQVCWKWRKVVSDSAAANDYRHFLDGNQYSQRSIARYQRVFGMGFVSPGGAVTAAEFASTLSLRPEDVVLDIGCGLGGAAFLMARTYGCFVYGIDLSVNMILTALETAAAASSGDRVSFEVSDCTKRDFDDASFDFVHSRDALLHVKDKAELFARLRRMLRPGGRLLLTDYCRGEEPATPDFEAYVAGRGYDLRTQGEYLALLAAAGFMDVEVDNCTQRLGACLEEELGRLEEEKEEFIGEFGKQEYAEMVDLWSSKLARCRAGEHRWVLLRARTPTDGEEAR
jgi:phosphoethanolamine N-methyltransferase